MLTMEERPESAERNKERQAPLRVPEPGMQVASNQGGRGEGWSFACPLRGARHQVDGEPTKAEEKAEHDADSEGAGRRSKGNESRTETTEMEASLQSWLGRLCRPALGIILV